MPTHPLLLRLYCGSDLRQYLHFCTKKHVLRVMDMPGERGLSHYGTDMTDSAHVTLHRYLFQQPRLLEAQHTSSLRPHTLVASGRIH
jgi:hypothetical protein